jgi:hypothetical protein
MDDLLQQGIIAYKAGKRDETRKIFISVVKQSPGNERAWDACMMSPIMTRSVPIA